VSSGVGVLLDPAARRDGLLVAFCDRRGGVGSWPYDSLNLGARVGDDGAAVTENRRRAARACGFDVGALRLSRQVHGAKVIEVSPLFSPHQVAVGATTCTENSGSPVVVGEADGLLARHSGPVLGILTADCAAVVVAGRSGVALLHAGWRGLAAGVVAAGVAEVGGAHKAWVGPAIKACCYEVGAEVVDAFGRAGLPVADASHVDIPNAAAAALVASGVSEVACAEVCTACSPDYFSHRRDGVTGRQGAFAALLEPN
jgi:purine-nucleoside/S-methyl-5'-thioadenosine phosphorylase / adenosine deaminase